ncbi:Uncharacterised protein [Moraxella caviae]|nr:Uncharacterised protein [Moraxella caviae]
MTNETANNETSSNETLKSKSIILASLPTPCTKQAKNAR